jgi:hypothetical protein
LDSGLPHSGQNFLPVVLSVPHLVQRIELLGICLTTAFLVSLGIEKSMGTTSKMPPDWHQSVIDTIPAAVRFQPSTIDRRTTFSSRSACSAF